MPNVNAVAGLQVGNVVPEVITSVRVAYYESMDDNSSGVMRSVRPFRGLRTIGTYSD